MIKHVFTDVDLTFIGVDQKVQHDNLMAIKKIKEKGIGFSFCTGRLLVAMEDILNQSSINNKEDEYEICGNGAVICNTKGNVLYSNPLEKDSLIKTLDYFYSSNFKAFNIVSDDMYYFNYTPSSERYIKYPKCEVNKEQMFEISKNEDIYKLVLFIEDINKAEEIKKEVSRISNNTMSGVLSSTTYLEFGGKNVNKGEGVKRFCEIKNLDIKDILVIGDNFNDESMLKIAGHSACPQNAIKEIKDLVEYVSNKECGECAFADIINHFI